MGRRPVVAVWKQLWLAPSQTFVANQVAAMSRWRPFLVGARHLPDGLPIVPDLAPFRDTRFSRAHHRVRRATGYHGVYDRLLREEGVRIVHAHFGPSAINILPVARRLGIPLVVTFHGFDVNVLPHRPGRQAAWYRRRLTALFAGASALVAPSAVVRERLLALGAPAPKLRVLPIGIPTAAEPAGTGVRHGIVHVGRMIEAKGATDLVRAVAGLPDDLRRTPVLIVGDGPERERVARLADQLDVDVELVGRRTPAEVSEHLSDARIFCGPSRTGTTGSVETFGLVFLEAALAGLPVVAYHHGGVPEAVLDGRTGLLAAEGDGAGLSRHLERLLRDPVGAEAMGRAGRQRVLDEFDVVRCTAALEDLYDELAR